MTSEVSILSQFRHENDTWKRILEFITGENIHLKNRLSEILRNIESNDHIQLERIEYFHNKLLNSDETSRRLREEVADIEIQLSRSNNTDSLLMKGFQKKQINLMKELKSVEEKFNKLKYEFNSYIDEIL